MPACPVLTWKGKFRGFRRLQASFKHLEYLQLFGGVSCQLSVLVEVVFIKASEVPLALPSGGRELRGQQD